MYFEGKNTPLMPGDHIISDIFLSDEDYLVSVTRGFNFLYFSGSPSDNKRIIPAQFSFYELCTIMADSAGCAIKPLGDNVYEIVAR